MMKHSKQRDSIQAFLMTRSDHPTAESVYMNIREEFPRISLATVYRNLSLLAELGEIKKISYANGPDRFDPNVEPHNHFRCDCCGALLDLDMENLGFIDEMARQTFCGKIHGHSLFFHGVCPDCLESTVS